MNVNAGRIWREFWTSLALLAVLGAGFASYRWRPALERAVLARFQPPPPPAPAPDPEASRFVPPVEETALPAAPRHRHTEVLSASPDEPAPEGNVFRLKGRSESGP